MDYFEKIARMYAGKDFELAYSDIQRETGAASVTLKRAIQALEADGVISVNPGRNSRYARFSFLLGQQEVADQESNVAKEEIQNEAKDEQPGEQVDDLTNEFKDLIHLVDNLRRRVRTQEMTIAVLQDRLAELEDKMHKR